MPLRKEPGQGGFLLLLLTALGLIGLAPVDEWIGSAGVVLDITTTALFVSAVYSVSNRKGAVVVCLALAVPAITATWLRPVFPGLWLAVVGKLCGAAVLFFLIALIIRFIFAHHQEVNRDLLAGAALVYLLMAVAWAHLYQLAELLQPGSFLIAHPGASADARLLVYYSFVTLTSVGYGDLSPATTLTRSLAVLEAVIGQLYLVLAVSSLVGIRVSQRGHE